MRWWRVGVVAVALAAAMFPVPQALVERWYSGWLFPLLQPHVTAAANRVPFALFDLLLAIVAVLVLLVLGRAMRDWRRRRWRALGEAATATVVLGAVLFLWFWAAWGLNYQRVPIEARLVRAAATSDAVTALATRAVAEVNRLHAPAHQAGFEPALDRDPRLRAAFAETLRALGHGQPIEPGRVKPTAIGWYLRWAGVDGMISPFTLEVLANPDLLPFERPFVAAHEWGHLAGYGDEAEASFVGWVTCMHGDAPAQYSGWLFLLWQARAEVPGATRRQLDAALEPGPRADIAAVVARLTRGTRPQIQRASWAAYDRYLKANRVDEGVRSYSRVLELLARTEFDASWTPTLISR